MLREKSCRGNDPSGRPDQDGSYAYADCVVALVFRDEACATPDQDGSCAYADCVGLMDGLQCPACTEPRGDLTPTDSDRDHRFV